MINDLDLATWRGVSGLSLRMLATTSPHVGTEEKNIFQTDKEKSVFLEKLNETSNEHSVVCPACSLMDNHYHFFIKTPRANNSQAMHYVNTSSNNWFKAEHGIIG